MILVALFWFALYFLPAIVSACRKHHQNGAIFALNLFLGWTCIGWIVAFIWAVSAVKQQTPDGRIA